MILLDTHIWVWRVTDETRLTPKQLSAIEKSESTGIGISVISCWEIALLVEKKKLGFSVPVKEWLKEALKYPGVLPLGITKDEALELITSYWGGMVRAGADTFWEVYDPSNSQLSPYGNVMINSYCHAWSCTPAYLLRSGGLV